MSSLKDMQGRNCIFQLRVGDEYFNVLCAKTWGLSVTTKMKETTTPGSGFWQEYRPQKLSYTLSLNAVVMIAGENGEPTVKDLFQNQMNFLPCNYRMVCEDNSGALLVIIGQAYVTNTSIDSNPINLLNGTVQFQGNGDIELADNIPEYILLTTMVLGIGASGKFRLLLGDADENVIFDSSLSPEAQLNDGWLLPGSILESSIIKGSYYYAIQWKDVTSDDNSFNLSGPPPAPGTRTFNHGDGVINDHPNFYDFTADRSATFELGEPYVPPACINVAIEGSPMLPDGEVGQIYSYSFPITGTAPFVLTVNNRPSWMSISIVGSNVFFTGMAMTAGTDIPVSITITNCSEGAVSFSQNIEIIPPTKGKLVIARLGNNPVTICGEPIGNIYILPPASAALPGVRIFADEAMTTPVVAGYIVPDNFIKNVYEIDSTMPGESYVGSPTGNVC